MITSSIEVETRHKVLLVDDDAVSLEVMALLIAHEGHQVVRANDAGSALALLAGYGTGRPDVLLVDLQMPGVSGGQLAERIRAMEGPELLLLAMSATEVQRRQLLAFDGFLLKPLALDDLRRALQPKKGARGPAARVAPSAKAAPPPKGQMLEMPVLDRAVVAKLLTMMPVQALNNVVAACIADTRACVEALQNQVRAGDGATVSRYAHRIKGAASMIGATHIARLACGLEMGGYEEADTRRVLDNLLSACSKLERMLLADKITNTPGPHDHNDNRSYT